MSELQRLIDTRDRILTYGATPEHHDEDWRYFQGRIDAQQEIDSLRAELDALQAKHEGATYALRLVKSYGSDGEREDGVSVSYYVDKALAESEGE